MDAGTPPGTALSPRSVWVPRGKAAEALAGLLAPYDPGGTLSAEAAAMWREGMNEQTRDAYVYQLLRWIVWSGEVGRRTLPEADERPSQWMDEMKVNIQEWITAHWSFKDSKTGRLRGRNGQPYAPDTVRLALAAISKLYRRRGLPSPTRHDDVVEHMASYAGRWKRHKYKHDIAAEITLEEVVRMVRCLDLETVAGLRDAFLIRLAAESGRRNSELMSLDWDNLRFKSATRLEVSIPISKTNQQGDREDRAMVEADLILEPDIDTLLLGREWREVSAAAGFTAGAVFRHVATGQKRKDGTRSGTVLDSRMNRKNYQDVVGMAARKSGVIYDPETGEIRKVVPHSFRVFMAAETLRAGGTLGTVCDQGGWDRESPVVLRYDRRANRWGDDNPGVRIRKLAAEERAEAVARQAAARGGQ